MHLIYLTLPEKDVLEHYAQDCPIKLTRLKSHALLMRERRLLIRDIAGLVFRSERTVTSWFKDFSQRRLASLFSDKLNNENASKLTRVQKEEIKHLIGRPPDEYGIPKEFWDVPKLKEYVNAEFGVIYESNQSYHFLLRFSGLSFKYPDKLSPRRNEQEILKQIKQVKEEIKPLLANPEWMVFAADEIRIQLESEIRRAWLVKGKRTVVKTERSKEHQNYLGFLDQKTGVCQVFEIARGNQVETIRVLKKLVNQYPDKNICVIWDNAKWHKGKLLREQLSANGKLKRLHLINFPPYAPEHNPIEHVWNYGKNKIKNRSGQLFENIRHDFLESINNKSFNYQI